ncbi:hypothetical protein [Paenibacillus sp. NPDC058071]|uniref:hypothetical protein n=1 Tax=Paenibacillus sp. NPDC058071 TaxID=3346326 RepID=UPI0036DF229F
MNAREREQMIIDNYRRDEQTMILVFAQWCVNQRIDPVELYAHAYPRQSANEALQEAIAQTVPPGEAAEIDDDTVLTVLSLFGNEELAFAVTEEIDKIRAAKRRSSQ